MSGRPAILAAALGYAARGWPVFPCGTDKKPLTPHGFKDASTEPQAIRAWWQRWPGAAVGVDCGGAGLFVIDCDVKNGADGIGAFEALGIAHTEALHAQTPSGGLHVVYKNTGAQLGNTAGKLAPGIDTRGAGGYILLPPSQIAAGSYTALDDWQREPGALPGALRALLEKMPRPTPPAAAAPARHSSGRGYGAAALLAEVDRVTQAMEGTRNETLNSAAFNLGQLIAGGELSPGIVRAELLRAALVAGLGESEAQKTIDSGINGGLGSPRQRPTHNQVISVSSHDNDAGSTEETPTHDQVISVSSKGKGETLTPASAVIDLSLAPDLPEYARLTTEQEAEARNTGAWLDAFVQFAGEASPMTPAAFHIAAGVFLGGLVIARRLFLDVSVKENAIYPNLYMLYLGPSTIQRKSTALHVVKGLLKAAGLEHFLLADQQTPEALAVDLTTRVPFTFDSWQTTVQGRWLRERALAAQRGWLLEEAAKLLDSFNRDFTAGLLPMVLDIYDCPDEAMTRNTLSRGRELVEKPYLNIFGVTTYGDMAEHLEKRRLWSNGFFARFALVGSDDVGTWRFWPEPKVYPAELVQGLRRVATQLLPVPEAYITETDLPGTNNNGNGEPRKVKEIELTTPLIASKVQLERGGEAWEAWERYARATSFDMLTGETVHDDFKPSYGRLGTMLIKVAIILAAFDAEKLPVTLEPRHIYRAQEIVELWRANLHEVFGKMRALETTGEYTASIKAILARAGGAWVPRRDLLRALKVKWSDIAPLVTDLLEAGELEQEEVKNERGRPTNQYRLVLSGP